MQRCPTCKQPIPGTGHVRVCVECSNPITRHHKWTWTDDGRQRHRFCDNPTSYKPLAEMTAKDWYIRGVGPDPDG